MISAPLPTEMSRAATTVDPVSTTILQKRDVIRTAQNLRQQGDVAGPSCTSTDKAESCACKDGQMCIAYASNCKCFGTPTGSSSDTGSSGAKRTN
jgi:hypothetical protein